MNPITPFTSLLRPSLQASSSRLPIITLPHASSSSSFSTSSPDLASRSRRITAKVKRDRHIKATAERAIKVDRRRIDFVLGYLPTGDKNPWEGCRLQRVLLRPEAVYSAPPVDYAAGETPNRYLPGLAQEDQGMLFGALPYTSTSLKVRRAPISGSADSHTAVADLEAGKVEQMQRMLNLRNASKKGIEVVNRQRVIEEFGGVREGKGENTGSSEVQAALLTQKIRSMAEHLQNNKKDNSNRRSLRTLVHQRQQILRYFARKEPEKYEQLLTDLGLEKRGVEGEITV